MTLCGWTLAVVGLLLLGIVAVVVARMIAWQYVYNHYEEVVQTAIKQGICPESLEGKYTATNELVECMIRTQAVKYGGLWRFYRLLKTRPNSVSNDEPLKCLGAWCPQS